jgi:spore maturation protein CgeB
MTRNPSTGSAESVLLVRAAPDATNPNLSLADCVAEALSDRLGAEHVSTCSLGSAVERADARQGGFVLVFGSALADECDYRTLTARARRRGLPLGFWAADDPYEFDMAYKYAALSDLVFTNDRWTSRHYAFHRTGGVHHLPLGASKNRHHRKLLMDDRDYLHDVFFCGVGFDNRQTIVDGLRPLLSRVETLICGSDWDETAPYIQNRRMDHDELMDAYQHSRIVLNMGRDFHYANDTYRVAPSTPGPRTFEAAMAGGFQLAFADRPEILDYYALNDEVVLFDGLDSAATAIGRYLENPGERISVAAAAQQRTLREHQYAHRIDAILREVGALDAGRRI